MLRPLINQQDHISGAGDAAVTLVEYGDYQCPHCGHAYPIIKKVQEEMGDSLRFVFRNFPLSEMHPQAFMAAMATEAAARQNAFWPMHDIIFENQQHLHEHDLLGYAKALELDAGQFENDMKDKELKQKIEADFESGIMSGVNGTPGFFINGQRYNGSWEFTDLFQVLRQLTHK